MKPIDKTVFVAIATSVITVIVIGVIGLGEVAANKNAILAYFGEQYLSAVKAQTATSTPAGGALLTQDALVTSAVEKASPAVVSIVITKDVPVMQEYMAPFNPFPGFGQGFNIQIPQYRQNGTQEQQVGGGTAFVISSDGLAVTNDHVVSDTTASYTAFANDGKKYDVKVIARDATLDIAVIQLQNAHFSTYLSFGDSSKVKLGQSVIAIGNALGEFRNTVSVGVISGLSRNVTAGDQLTGSTEQLDEVLQTDAAINPGNSGGPLLDLYGNVIGMNTATVSGSQNIGFAIPANIIKNAVESVKQNGKIITPYLGVRYVQVTQALKQENNLTVDYGALIERGSTPDQLAVMPGSPADKAGLEENDIILEVDGVKLDQNHPLSSVIQDKKVGETITLTVLHKGKTETLKATLEAAPSSSG